MAYQQVRTVLEHVERFHREAAKRYDGMANECCNDRVKMLLEYLVSHQRLIERTINQSRVDMPDRVLETWLTTTHETAVLTDSIAKIAVPTTVDDVIELAMKLEDQVISVYQEIVNRDAPDWVVEKFRNLLDMEEHQQMRMVTQAMRGADL